MQEEVKNCQNCSKNFKIESEDFSFYEKMEVPPPTWCPECRMVRRLACVNSWSLFWRNCSKCSKRTLSVYPPTQNIEVFCQPCWWGDSWDGTEHAMDYDPKRPFLQQLRELSEKTPYPALETEYLTLKNCEYTNAISYSKNCTLAIWADYCESVYHSSILNGVKDSIDCLRVFSSELCYESIGQRQACYKSFYSEECESCSDIWFSRNCYGCMNCVGCVNLRGAKYNIFNVQYSREEYLKKIKELKLDTYSGIKKLKKEAEIFWKKFPYRAYTGDTFNLNVTGEYVYKSKNSREMYIGSHAENCKWSQFITVKTAKDCMDYSGWGNNAELICDSVNVGNNVSNIKFSVFCFPDCLNLEYCIWNIAGKNNFGCVNLKRKSYCILNKQYTKEEYEVVKEKIIEDMKKNPYVDEKGRVWPYGELFGAGFGKFAYNNSNANKFCPKTKEQAIQAGYSWNDVESDTHAVSLKSFELPETMEKTDESILNEVLECLECLRGYKILKGELDLLRKMNLPIPHVCPKCRENNRFLRMNKPGLYNRACAKCNADIYTPYAPDRPEIVYCVKCYQQEFA